MSRINSLKFMEFCIDEYYIQNEEKMKFNLD